MLHQVYGVGTISKPNPSSNERILREDVHILTYLCPVLALIFRGSNDREMGCTEKQFLNLEGNHFNEITNVTAALKLVTPQILTTCVTFQMLHSYTHGFEFETKTYRGNVL